MAFNGSGTFNRTNGVNSGSATWVDDRDAGAKILAGRHDTHDQDIADGLTNCITKDGQTTVTANIPMNSNKFTGLAAGSSANDSVRLVQLQDGVTVYAGSSSGTDTITAGLTPALTAYAAGQRFIFLAGGTNTGSATLNIDSQGAKTIKYVNGSTLAAGAIVSGDVVDVIYDGTDFILQNPQVHDDVVVSGDVVFSQSTINAAGSVLGDATAITTQFTLVNAADGTKGVVLPSGAAVGATYWVHNNSGSNNLILYASSGQDINASGSVTVAAVETAILMRTSSTEWRGGVSVNF